MMRVSARSEPVQCQIQAVKVRGRRAERDEHIHIGGAVPQRLVSPRIKMPADEKLNEGGRHELEQRMHEQIRRSDPGSPGEVPRHAP